MTRLGAETAASPSAQPETQHTLADSLRIVGYRRNGETGGDVAAVHNEKQGTMGVVQAIPEGRAEVADEAAKAGLEVFHTEFDPEYPRSTAMRAMSEVNDVAAREGVPLTATFVHTYEKKGGSIGLVSASVGEAHAALFPIHLNRDVVEPIVKRHLPGSRLDGSRGALADVQIDEVDLVPGDRVAILSSDVYARILGGQVPKETLESASKARVALDAAKALIGNVKTRRDQIVLIQDIKEEKGGIAGWLRERRRRRQRHNAARASGAAATAAATAAAAAPTNVTPPSRPRANPPISAANVTPAPGTGAAPRAPVRGPNTSSVKPNRRNPIAAGALAVGAAAVALAAGTKKMMSRWNDPDRRAARIRRQEERKANNKLSWYDKAEGATVLALSRLPRDREKYYRDHMNDPRYANRNVWTDEMIREDLNRRRARRNMAVGALAIAAAAGTAVLIYYLTKNPHHHTTAPGGPHSSAPSSPPPSGSNAPPSGGNTPPPGGSAPPPGPQNPPNAPGSNYQYDVTVAKQPFVVEYKSGIINEISELYEKLVGHKPPDDLADRIYYNRPASIGTHMINLPTYTGPTPGDIRISEPSSSANWTPKFADYVARAISQNAG